MFFNHLHTVGQVKSEYRRLAKIHHPNFGGDAVTMRRINSEYRGRLKVTTVPSPLSGTSKGD